MVFPPATRLIKCDVQTDDVIYKWKDFVDGGNGCLYGIPCRAHRVVEFHLEDKSMKEIGPDLGDGGSKYKNGVDKYRNGIKTANEEWLLWTKAVLAEDGNIYAANKFGQILLIDTAQNDSKIIGNKIFNEGCPAYGSQAYKRGWGNAVIGADKCIYFPSSCHDRVLRYNPTTQSISLIGESYGEKEWKWEGAVLASDGFIYCIPCQANDILQIDSRHVNDKVLEIIDDIYKGHEYVEGNTYAPNNYTKDATFDEQKCCTIA